ncbi:hypothetical protein QG071_09555, partial [Kingella kingae]|uniref:hypothetical protein n=3 Tax=Kingella kingae TaxID=504 RepID=UPI00254C5D7F
MARILHLFWIFSNFLQSLSSRILKNSLHFLSTKVQAAFFVYINGQTLLLHQCPSSNVHIETLYIARSSKDRERIQAWV